LISSPGVAPGSFTEYTFRDFGVIGENGKGVPANAGTPIYLSVGQAAIFAIKVSG
jgi:hypothetical protein